MMLFTAKLKKLILLILFLFSVHSLSHATLKTAYAEPENFTDIESVSYSDETSLNIFDDELKRSKAIQQRIGEGQQLMIVFTDIDAAGRVIYRRGRDVRLVRSIYPPRLKFKYTLSDAKGNDLQSGEVDLRDAAFTFDIGRRLSSRTFYFEIKLLEDWAGRHI